MEKINDKILKLESEINDLPIGYISKKNINGKIRKYHQWTENGKKKSKYLDDKLADILAEKINKRRTLEKELKEMKKQVPKKSKINYSDYHCEILIGDTLRSFISQASHLNRRPIIQEIIDYTKSELNSKVLILYGLRRTGKTTLIQQTISSFNDEEYKKTAFMQIRTGNTLADVNSDLKKLQANGFKYIFIDEVTLLEDFIEGAAIFSDIYAMSGMKIVLSGTDSLGFVFSADDQLYNRCKLIHTTFIPYKEFESVLGIKGIDEYIRYGGTMSVGGVYYNANSTFINIESTDEYVDSAIARNIQHSLKFYQYENHFRHLQELYDNNELTSAINRVVEDINHRFTIDVLTRDFISHDLGISARNLRHDKDNPTDILDTIDIDSFTERLKQALEIKNKNEQNIKITDAHKTEIKEYLDLLDLTVDIPVQTLPVTNNSEYMTVISQPGLRYSQAEELIKQLMLDASFQNISALDRKKISSRILDEIKGRMMEEIVLLETKKAFPSKEVFKLKFAVGEFDMVIFDSENVTCEIYEIKHSKEIVSQQYRHLIDDDKCKATEFRFGSIVRKCVIYRGESKDVENIHYINVEEYLKNL